ncbi:hypothetical protein PMAYCL1PPCAC_30302, partial [Pristionchus mayeri]
LLPLLLCFAVHSQNHPERTEEYTRKVISGLIKERRRYNLAKYGPMQSTYHRERDLEDCSDYCNQK